MLEYHKINSVFMRDPADKHKSFLFGEWARPEFKLLANCEWEWTEKVDGTNVRVELFDGKVSFGGRTEAAQMPVSLVSRLTELFPAEKLIRKFERVKDDFLAITLFGEGYGAKIQKGGGNYKPDGVDFVLFDVAFGAQWASRPVVDGIADELGIWSVPVVGYGTLHEAIEMARGGFNSSWGWGDFLAEGLVMRPSVELRTSTGSRVITKVKCKDFT